MLVAALIDGFNLFHNMNKKKFKQYKWLNFSKMLRNYVNKDDDLEIHYFTTINYQDIVAYKYEKEKYKGKLERHLALIKAEESRGVYVHYGYFRNTEFICKECGHKNIIRKEKQTDVGIGAYLSYLAFSRDIHRFIILSADTDLIPAIELVKKYGEQIRVELLLPPGQIKSKISDYCDNTYQLKEDVLKNSLFPLIFENKNKETIVCPKEWKIL